MPLASTGLHHADPVRSSHFDIRTLFSLCLCASVAISCHCQFPELDAIFSFAAFTTT
jgi:hypothetical protein